MKIFIGWDSREDIAYQVARQSILDNTTEPVEIIPLKQKVLKSENMYWRDEDKLSSTEFTFTRFLIPELMNFNGWALFIDCDFVFVDDIKKIFKQKDDRYAVMCAKHDYTPKSSIKMDGQQQMPYPRKNWSSMMLINCGHLSNKVCNKEFVNDSSTTGQTLHRFTWLNDSEIGELNHEWNWLVGWYKEPKDGKPKAIHYTEGGPWFPKYENCEYAKEWYKYEARYYKTQLDIQKKKLNYELTRIKNIDDLSVPVDVKLTLKNNLYQQIDPTNSFNLIKDIPMPKPIRVAAVHNTDYESLEAGFDPILESFALGSNGTLIRWGLDNLSPKEVPLVIRGLASDSQRALKWCMDTGTDFYAIDTGYLQPSTKKEYHRLTKNNLQHLGPIIERPTDRLKLLNWKYRKPNLGSKILVCPPSHKVMKFYNMDLDKWMDELVVEIKKYSDRPIEIRLKPPRSQRVTTDTIWSALDDAYCLITYNSIAATEALLYGVPAIALAPNAATVLCNTKISDLEKEIKQPSKDDLYAFASHLSYCQFTQAEFQTGYAFSVVNEQ
jgi:lipopolysaccharide biosynthesis glycosyltransferase